MAVFNIIVVTLSIYVTLEITPAVSIQRTGIAHAIPGSDLALGGTPMAVISGKSRFNCLRECLERSCSAFNYGLQQCELMSVYLCEDVEVLTTRANFKYYDVETGNFVQMADHYSAESDCLVLNRCSPKCYAATTTTASATTAAVPTTTTASATTAAVATTTTAAKTTAVATTTTASATTAAVTTTTTASATTAAVTTTTTASATTAAVPTTTTASATTAAVATTTIASATTAAVATTTTASTTTAPFATTTTAATTTAVATTTTASATTAAVTTTTVTPGPSDVGISCFTDADCTPGVTQCSSSGVCTCVADFIYNPGTNDCVTECPGGYGSTFTETIGHYIDGYDDSTMIQNPMENCMAACNHEVYSWCVSFEYEISFGYCYLSSVTKHNHESEWSEHSDWDYYQRDCA